MYQLRAFVWGEVQGVNFRYYTVLEAEKLGLKGFVRNLRDGRVEVIAQGEKGQLQSLLEWLKRGPAFASVSNVDSKFETPQKLFQKFSIEF